jgi:hypothetical protein
MRDPKEWYGLNELRLDWVARQETMSFIDPRHRVQYMIHGHVYTISLDKAFLIRLMSSLFWRAHVSALLWPPRGCTTVEVV